MKLWKSSWSHSEIFVPSIWNWEWSLWKIPSLESCMMLLPRKKSHKVMSNPKTGDKKIENIHAIGTADQSAEIPLQDNTNTPHILDNPHLYLHILIHKHWLWEWYTSFPTATSRLGSSHKTPTMSAWSNSSKYNNYCFQGSHNTLWHLWAHLDTLWPLQIMCVPCSELCMPSNSGSPNLLWHEACHPQLWYLHFIDWSSTYGTLNPQGNADAKSEVLVLLALIGAKQKN